MLPYNNLSYVYTDLILKWLCFVILYWSVASSDHFSFSKHKIFTDIPSNALVIIFFSNLLAFAVIITKYCHMWRITCFLLNEYFDLWSTLHFISNQYLLMYLLTYQLFVLFIWFNTNLIQLNLYCLRWKFSQIIIYVSVFIALVYSLQLSVL